MSQPGKPLQTSICIFLPKINPLALATEHFIKLTFIKDHRSTQYHYVSHDLDVTLGPPSNKHPGPQVYQAQNASLGFKSNRNDRDILFIHHDQCNLHLLQNLRCEGMQVQL